MASHVPQIQNVQVIIVMVEFEEIKLMEGGMIGVPAKSHAAQELNQERAPILLLNTGE